MTAIPLINLLPSEIVARRARARVIRAWVAVGCLGVGLLVGGVIVTRAPSVIGGVSSQRRLETLEAEIASIEAEIPTLNGQLEAMGTRLKMIDMLEDRPDWGLLLGYLSEVMGEGVALSRCELEWVGEDAMLLRIRGLGEKPGREQALVVGLERSGLFDETTLVETRRELVDGAERISFEIRCRFDPTPGGGAAP